MKKIIFLLLISIAAYAQPPSSPSCQSKVSKMIWKNPLPEKQTNSDGEFNKWLKDSTVKSAFNSYITKDNVKITERMIRISKDSVMMLHCMYHDFNCSYIAWFFDPKDFHSTDAVDILGSGVSFSTDSLLLVPKVMRAFDTSIK